ncbi:hypothetical protein [Gryllotalpicola protaetiae]|uniref:hypothetical protein n=1 Tax=Gryllotalpicola protaetiae TaxID=2419771 RepID=UPI0015E877FC|nr:hypothetical protein [Gryllotalpicola protaetiae]
MPGTVHTAGGPEHYTVSVVFTRRPTAGEIDAINGPETRAALENAHYPQVTLKVSDRRLEIGNTSLEELGNGLARVVAGMLARISANDEARTHMADDEVIDQDQRNAQRAASVRELVDAISLNPTGTAQPSDELGLARLVPALLPSALGTEFASRRYTVTAEFTRPPTRTELALIDGPAARARIDEAGYTAVTLKTRDRRLEIHDTNLAELAEGLAAVTVALLAEITHTATAHDAETAAEATRLAQQEQQRAEYVQSAAAAISFSAPAESAPSARDQEKDAPSQPSELGEWEDEGGSAAAGRQARTQPSG